MDLEKELAEFKEKVKDEFRKMKETFDKVLGQISELTAQIEDIKKAKKEKSDESWF